MNRKEFLANTCKLGLCACAGMFLPGKVSAKGDTAVADTCPPNENEWRMEFVQNRFAKFVDVIDANLDQDSKTRMIEQFGRACGKEMVADQLKQYIGDIDGFLEFIKSNWVEDAGYDKVKNEITVTGKPTKKCFCPFVDGSRMSRDFCNCSTGWAKEIFGTILDREVETEMTETVLRGADRCSHKIKIVV